VFVVASEALSEVRKAKTTAQVSLRTDVTRVVVRDVAERLEQARQSLDDLKEAARAQEIVFEEAQEFSVEVELAAPDAA